MPKAAKFALFTLATVAGLLLAAGGIVALVFDAEHFKSLAVERMQRDFHRTLAIGGAVELRFLPRLGVQVGAATLSEPGGGTTFAAVESARVSLAWWPLLRGQLVLGRVHVQGLRAQVTRHADGSTSIDDLLNPSAPRPAASATPAAQAPMRFDIDGVTLAGATLIFDDRLQRRRVELTQAAFELGHLAPGVAGEARFQGRVRADRPALDADAVVAGRLLFDPASGRHALDGLRATLDGRLGGLEGAKLEVGGDLGLTLQPRRLELIGGAVKLQGRLAQGPLELRLEVPELRLDGQRVAAGPIVAVASLRQDPRTLQARFTLPAYTGPVQGIELPAVEGVLTLDGGPLQAEARWSGPLLADLDRHVVSSPRTGLALNGRQGDTAFRGSLAAAWVADLPSASIALTNLAVDALLPNPKGGTLALKVQGSAGLGLTPQRLEARGSGQLDDSRFEGRFSVQDFAAPAWDFDLDVDRIDLDRYRAASAAGAAPGPAATAADASAFDLSALRDLRASGRLRVGQLKAAGLTARQLQAGVQARDGRLDIHPLAADIYQGRVSGSLSLVADAPPRLSTRQTWSGIAVGPLLKDALGEERLTGRGHLEVDLRTQGGTVAAMTKALDGQARIELHDGLVRGVNVAQIVRSAAVMLGRGPAPPAGTAVASDATDFSELSGSFRIQHGVAHNDDLRARTPMLQVNGSGQIDLVAGRLDYLLKATVTDTLAGQGGPEWQALRGQTVPVRLSGPFGAIGYRVDAARLVQDLARKTLEEKARDALPAAQQRLLEKFKGLLGK